MSGTEGMTVAEMLALLDAHPPDDPRHALANAVRESEAGSLKAWMIVGEDDDGQPVDYRQFLALGFVNGAFPPKYCLIPGVDDAESQSEIEEVAVALANERPRATSLEAIRYLAHAQVKTLVYVGYGHLRDTKDTVISLWHHPGLPLRRAVHLALVALASDDTHRLKRGS